MSTLQAQNQDDYPDAATKHLGDARALVAALRHDGACYLLGYVVECSLKAVFVHDQAWQAGARVHDTALINLAYQVVSRQRPYGHNLAALLAATVGPEGARYLSDLQIWLNGATVLQWRETLRYRSPTPDAALRAGSWIHWAELVYDATVVQMQLDGVL